MDTTSDEKIGRKRQNDGEITSTKLVLGGPLIWTEYIRVEYISLVARQKIIINWNLALSIFLALFLTAN